MKTSGLSIATCLFVFSSAVTLAGPVVGTRASSMQSPGIARYYSSYYGTGSGLAPSYTPQLGYGRQGLNRDDRKVIQKLDLQVKDLTGNSAAKACRGFQTVGDCVAAAHASCNLSVSFDSLRAQMTGNRSKRLDRAIANLKPDANAKLEAARARRQAQGDVQASLPQAPESQS
jgi:hypothetical protein